MNEFDGFLDDVTDASAHKGGCGVGKLLTELGDQGAQIGAALDRPEITHQAIAAALKRRIGADAPSAFTVGRHRRGLCKCPQTEES
ncbi:hypothetical protein [Streptomyces sp. NPDC002666]